ncbi:hypothetical protein Tco_0436160 [Tanacetum coccineum]
MNNPDITIEEYIRIETKKAIRCAQVYNWETATYGKISYFEDIDYFKNFETEFPAIVYEDALTSEPKVSPEPTVSPHHVKEVDLEFEISFAESDDEDYTVIYNNDSFSYKIISVNDLKSDADNDDGKIDVKLSSENISIEPLGSVIDANVDTYSHAFDENFEKNHDTPNMALPPRVERHMWLRFDAQDYLEGDILDFEDRLARIYDRMVHLGADGQVATYKPCLEAVVGIHGPLVRELILKFFSTYRDPLRRLCHRLIAFSIAGRGQAPEKVTTTYLLYLRSMDEGATVNVPYLLAYYLFRHALGRKLGAKMSGGHLIAYLGVHLGVITKLGDVVTWVAMGLEGQHAGTAAASPTPRTDGERLQRLEEEVHRLGKILVQQGALIDRLSIDLSRFATKMIGRMTQVMDASGLRYQEFDGSFVGSSQVLYQRRSFRQRTDGSGTSSVDSAPTRSLISLPLISFSFIFLWT